MRLATMQVLHFFFSFAAIPVSSILVAIEAGLHPRTSVHGLSLAPRGTSRLFAATNGFAERRLVLF